MGIRNSTRAARRTVISTQDACALRTAVEHFRKAAHIAEAAAGCFPIGDELGEPTIPRQRVAEIVRLAIAALDEGHDALADSWDEKDDLHGTVFEVADVLCLVEQALDAGAAFDGQDLTSCPPRGGLRLAVRLLGRLQEDIQSRVKPVQEAA